MDNNKIFNNISDLDKLFDSDVETEANKDIEFYYSPDEGVIKTDSCSENEALYFDEDLDSQNNNLSDSETIDDYYDEIPDSVPIDYSDDQVPDSVEEILDDFQEIEAHSVVEDSVLGKEKKKKNNKILPIILILILAIAAAVYFVFLKPEKYTVVFKDENGITLATETVKEGNTVTAPTPEEKEGYIFVSWMYQDEKFSLNTAIKDNYVLVAKYGEKCTVTFLDADGSVYTTEDVAKGECVKEPEYEVTESGKSCVWTLNGTKYEFTDAVTKDISLKAEIRTYVAATKVEFTVKNGYKVSVGKTNKDIVVKVSPSNATESPRFSSSDTSIFTVDSVSGAITGKKAGTAKLIVTVEDKTAEATVTVSEVTYTVTFKDGDLVVGTKTVKSGDKLILLEREDKNGSDGTLDYKFMYWATAEENNEDEESKTVYTEYKNDKLLTDDLVLYAVYKKAYKITFLNENGSTNQVVKVLEGETVTKPENDPEVTNKLFLYWALPSGNEFDFSLEVESDLTLTAKMRDYIKPTGINFEKTKYTITIGEDEKIDAILAPVNCTETPKYSSSDIAVLSVLEDGTLVGLSEGTVTLTATCEDYSCSTTVTVVKPEVKTVVVTSEKASISYNEDNAELNIIILNATINPDGTGATLEWTFECNDQSFSYDQYGNTLTVKLMKDTDGTCTVYATANGIKSNEITITAIKNPTTEDNNSSNEEN